MQELFPKEVTSGVPRITLTGHERLHVEQHRGLVACQPEEICFRTSIGLLHISGEGLHFMRYSSEEALIGGLIRSIAILPEGRKG